MEDEVLFRINKKNKEAYPLIAYLMALPYVEMLTPEDLPEDFRLPFFCPADDNELKKHVAEIEKDIFKSGLLIDNELVMNETEEILKHYESKMVG